MSMSGVIISFTFFMLGIVIPAMVTLYVYRDAKSRGMNEVLWTLIVLLTPAFIGLVLYLIMRSSNSERKCPNCSATVQEGWIVCPNCANPLPREYGKDPMQIQKKDKALRKILIMAILVPVLVLVVIGISFSNL